MFVACYKNLIASTILFKVLNVHHVGNEGTPVSVGYISAAGKVQLDLTKMKSYILDNRKEIPLNELHSQCQGTYLNRGSSHVIEVS